MAARATIVAVFLALVYIAASYRSDAEFWECNAARWQAAHFGALQGVASERGIRYPAAWAQGHIALYTQPPPEHKRSDVFVILREPEPHADCWLDEEWYKTEYPPTQSKVIER